LKVVTEEVVQMSDGKLFHAIGPATQNARLPRRRLLRDKVSTSCRARVAQVETVVTGTHKS